MNKKCGCAEMLTGIGNLLTGLAAVGAVLVAKEPVQSYFASLKQNQTQQQGQNQTQTVVVNPCKASEEANRLIKESKDPQRFDTAFRDIPESLPADKSQPAGLFIAPSFRDAAEQRLKGAASDEEKKKILQEYWNKSLSKETKGTVDVKLNGNL